MTLDPILAAPPVIQAHVAAATLALVAGPLALLRRRRDRWHRRLGYAWVAAMVAVALTGLLIPGSEFRVLGHFGPLHLRVPLTLWGLWEGVALARAGRVVDHRRAMRQVLIGAMGVAGLLTLIPGRVMNAAFFPESPGAGWIAIAAGGVALTAWALLTRRGRVPDRSLREG